MFLILWPLTYRLISIMHSSLFPGQYC
jgi:hypothetical protein